MIAQPDSTWIGQKIIAKYNYSLQSGKMLVANQTPSSVYTVERIEGERIWVTTGSGDAWIPGSQAVLFHEAIEFYTKEIESDPQNAKAFSERGIIWIHKGEYGKAIADFSEAIQFGPGEFSMYLSRGIAWRYEHEYDKAITDFGEAIRLDPESAAAYLPAWLCLGGQERIRQGNCRLQRINQTLSGIAASYSRMAVPGHAWRAKKEYDKAIADFNESINLDPNDCPCLHLAGQRLGGQERIRQGHHRL